MKKTLLATAIASIFVLFACVPEGKVSKDNPSVANNNANQSNISTSLAKQNQTSLNQLYEQATQLLFQQRAFSATMFGLSNREAGQYINDKIEVFSPKKEARLREALLSISNKISQFKSQDLDAVNQTNQQVMASLTRYFAGDAHFNIGYIDTWMGLSPFIVNQINGPLVDIPRIMQNDQAITNKSQALDYIARLGQFDRLISSIVEKQSFDAKQGWVPSKVTLEGAIHYLKGFTSASPEDHALVTVFIDKINNISSLSVTEKQLLSKQVINKVKMVVYPAYKSVTESSEALLAEARTESGIWAQPNGEAYYQDAIKQLGDSALTADEIHQLGLQEVTRISAEMDSILNEQGYQKGSVGQRMVKLTDEKRFLYEDSKAGRAELLNDINGYIAEITTKMSPVFKTAPSYKVEVRAFPEEVQDGSPGGMYTPPAIDGSKPGIYWINLRDMKANPRFGLKTLTYHEASPGHHWQAALNMDQTSMPFLRRIAPYNAYAEGWALYSEQVAFELGLYENDPFGNLGRLQAELFRAVRLVVDTGLHHKKWTREQAISYMSEQTGTAKSDVIAEIERYMAWPGQALGYKLGMLKILSLREKAKARLGEQFDLSEFHDVVLLGGSVPMTVLEKNIDQWLNDKGIL